MTTELLESRPADFAPGRTSAPASTRRVADARAAVAGRLSELAALAADWDGYGARAIDGRAILRARDVLEQALRLGLPDPSVFPLANGGVQLEWTAGSVELDLEIEPDGTSGVFVCDDQQLGQKIDGELPRESALFNLALARLFAYS